MIAAIEAFLHSPSCMTRVHPFASAYSSATLHLGAACAPYDESSGSFPPKSRREQGLQTSMAASNAQ